MQNRALDLDKDLDQVCSILPALQLLSLDWSRRNSNARQKGIKVDPFEANLLNENIQKDKKNYASCHRSKMTF